MNNLGFGGDFVFKTTKLVQFGSIQYMGMLGEIHNKIVCEIGYCLTSFLLQKIFGESDAVISTLVVRLKERVCLINDIQDVLQDIVNSLSADYSVQVLEAYLNYWLKELATEKVDHNILFLEAQENDANDKANVPTVAEIKRKNNDIEIPWDDFLNGKKTASALLTIERPLYHQILYARDNLILKASEDLWSLNFSSAWVEKANEHLKLDIAAIAAQYSLSVAEKLSRSELQRIIIAVTNDVLSHIRIGKDVTKAASVLEILRPAVLERIMKEIEVRPEELTGLNSSVLTGNFGVVHEFMDKFVAHKVSEIVNVVAQVIHDLEISDNYVPERESLPFRDNFAKELVLELGLPFFGNCGDEIVLRETVTKLLLDVINKRIGAWWSFLTEPSNMASWLIAFPITNVFVDKVFQLGNVTIYPSKEFRLYMAKTFSGMNESVFLHHIAKDSIWAVINDVTAHKYDPDKAIAIAMQVVQENLASLLLIVNPRPITEIVVGDVKILAQKALDGSLQGLSSKWAIGKEFFANAKMELDGTKLPIDNSWGEYLQAVNVLKSPIASRLRISMKKLLQAKSQTEDTLKFIYLLSCLKVLLVTEQDKSEDQWMIRAAFILAGPNINEEGFSYFGARSLLIEDIGRYMAAQKMLEIGWDISVDRMIERLELMVSRCLFTIYSVLSEPEFKHLDDLSLWFTVVYPNDAMIGGRSCDN